MEKRRKKQDLSEKVQFFLDRVGKKNKIRKSEADFAYPLQGNQA